MVRYREVNREVFYPIDGIQVVGADDIAFLKARAAGNARKRSRLCTHSKPDDLMQEMLIVHHREGFFSPHQHAAKAQSFHLIEGHAKVVLFDDAGTIRRVMPVGPEESGLPFYWRIPPAIFYAFVIETDWLVFFETTVGPFHRANTMEAPWAPRETDAAEAAIWSSDLERNADDFLRRATA